MIQMWEARPIGFIMLTKSETIYQMLVSVLGTGNTNMIEIILSDLWLIFFYVKIYKSGYFLRSPNAQRLSLPPTPSSGAAYVIPLMVTVPFSGSWPWLQGTLKNHFWGCGQDMDNVCKFQVIQSLAGVGNFCSGPWGSYVYASFLPSVLFSVAGGPCLYIAPFSTLGWKLSCFLFSTWLSQGPNSKYKETEIWKDWWSPVLTVWLSTVSLGQGWRKGCQVANSDRRVLLFY